jgi:hypothetical protein
MEDRTRVFLTSNIYLAAYLTIAPERIAGLGKIYFPADSDTANIEVFYSAVNSVKLHTLVEAFAKGVVTVDLLKFNQQRRFITGKIYERSTERIKARRANAGI